MWQIHPSRMWWPGWGGLAALALMIVHSSTVVHRNVHFTSFFRHNTVKILLLHGVCSPKILCIYTIMHLRRMLLLVTHCDLLRDVTDKPALQGGGAVVCRAFRIPSRPTSSCTNVSILAVRAQTSPATEVPVKVWSRTTRSL